jgi:carbonic anhydrase
MNAKRRIWLVISLLVGALLATSCAEQRKKEIKEVVTQYLQDEVNGDWIDQHELISADSAKQLPLPTNQVASPFSPKQMTEFSIKDVELQGATATVKIVATFAMVFPGGGSGLPEKYDLNIYCVHQPEEWKVDEIKTRMEALDKVIAPGAGDSWMMMMRNQVQQGQ